MQVCKTRNKVVSNAIRIEIRNDIDVIPEVDAPIYLSREYLTAFQESLEGKSNLLFPVIYRGDEIVAYGSMQEIRIDYASIHSFGRLFSSDKTILICLEGMLKSFVSSLNNKKGVKLLVLGNTQVSGPYGMWFKEELNETERALFWEALVQKIEHSDLNADILIVKDLDKLHSITKKTLVTNKFKEISALPIMKMEIPNAWETTEDYYEAFSSKYRIRAHSARKKFDGIVRRELTIEDLVACKEEIGFLYKNVYTRARFRLFQVQDSYFIALKKCLKEKFKVFGYYKNDVLIGFNSILICQNTCEAHLIGLNYEFNKTNSLYLNMLYDLVEETILANCSCLDFGRTAMEIKSTVGAVPSEADVFLKFTNPLLNNLASFILKKNTQEKWLQRHPFKEKIN
jgi:hypothetical protein